jgi:hypothetical protein
MQLGEVEGRGKPTVWTVPARGKQMEYIGTIPLCQNTIPLGCHNNFTCIIFNLKNKYSKQFRFLDKFLFLFINPPKKKKKKKTI